MKFQNLMFSSEDVEIHKENYQDITVVINLNKSIKFELILRLCDFVISSKRYSCGIYCLKFINVLKSRSEGNPNQNLIENFPLYSDFERD